MPFCVFQLLLSIEFTQPVKLHSLKIYGPAGNFFKATKLYLTFIHVQVSFSIFQRSVNKYDFLMAVTISWILTSQIFIIQSEYGLEVKCLDCFDLDLTGPPFC